MMTLCNNSHVLLFPNEKLYHVLAIIGFASLLIETATNLSSTLLWKTVTITIVCICFYTPGGRHDRKSLVAAAKVRPSIEETDSGRLRRSTSASTKKSATDFSGLISMSESISSGTELMKLEDILYYLLLHPADLTILMITYFLRTQVGKIPKGDNVTELKKQSKRKRAEDEGN